MSVIKELSKKDKYWREVAFKFCKDKSLADDLVNDMYLKIMHKEYCNDFYVIFTIKHLWLTHTKRKKTCGLDYPIKDTSAEFEYDDKEQKIIDKFNKLPFHQQELIVEHYDKSYRDIEKEFNINYAYAYREIHKGVRKVLGKNYKEYSNSNLKYQKPKKDESE